MAKPAAIIRDRSKFKKGKKYEEDIKDNTPIYMKQDFEPPKTLNKPELIVWDYMTNIFKNTLNSPVSDADRDLIQIYCRAKVATDRADRTMKTLKYKDYIQVRTGNKDKDDIPLYQLKPNPAAKAKKENAELCIKILTQLGLTPIARAKIGLQHANKHTGVDALKDIMNRKDD